MTHPALPNISKVQPLLAACPLKTEHTDWREPEKMSQNKEYNILRLHYERKTSTSKYRNTQSDVVYPGLLLRVTPAPQLHRGPSVVSQEAWLTPPAIIFDTPPKAQRKSTFKNECAISATETGNRYQVRLWKCTSIFKHDFSWLSLCEVRFELSHFLMYRSNRTLQNRQMPTQNPLETVHSMN